jgi:hypothetical protein
MVITVTAVDDWTTAVMPAPVSTPRKGVDVMRNSQRRNLSPASNRRAAVNVSIPKRKSPIPPRNPRNPAVINRLCSRLAGAAGHADGISKIVY